MTTLSIEEVGQLIDTSFLFKSLDEDTRADLKEGATVRSYSLGDVMIREDEEGLELFIIAKGNVEVSQLMADGDVKLAVLGPGALVGEVAVITEAPRTSSVIASSDVTAVTVMADTVREIITKNPKVKELLLRLIEGRARHTITLIPGLE